jgi:ABC-type antimicrobial peptide transport system permease subunit
VYAIAHAPAAGPFAVLLKIPLTTLAVSLPIAALVAVASAAIPAYRAARLNIVEGLRHVG